jgi:hypothetical protein
MEFNEIISKIVLGLLGYIASNYYRWNKKTWNQYVFIFYYDKRIWLYSNIYIIYK